MTRYRWFVFAGIAWCANILFTAYTIFRMEAISAGDQSSKLLMEEAESALINLFLRIVAFNPFILLSGDLKADDTIRKWSVILLGSLPVPLLIVVSVYGAMRCILWMEKRGWIRER